MKIVFCEFLLRYDNPACGRVFLEAVKLLKELFENAQVFPDALNASELRFFDDDDTRYDGLMVLPGFADVHVHLREPGFSYKETIASGSLAAARGGYTDICAMPNLNPVPDRLENLQVQQRIIEQTARIRVHPYGAITVAEQGRELADLNALAAYVCAFSDDGKGVQDESVMREAMAEAKKLGKMIAAHCEDNSLLRGGYIHQGAYAKAHGHAGICSESEWKQIERDLRLAKETGCAYHVCHISTRESVELIRKAKKEGVNVTCETAPHYLLLDDSMLQEDGRFKMNPPLRSECDREGLIEGLLDGTIDMIATDHAPHAAHEKDKGLKNSVMGIVGIETAFPLMYTYFVRTGILTLKKLLELMAGTPRRRFGLGENGFSVWALDQAYAIEPKDFASMGRSTPFEGWKVFGRCLLTISDGKIAWNDRNFQRRD